MSNTGKKVASIIGILIGVIVMIVGFVLPHSKTFSQASYPTTEIQQISTTPVGRDIGFGADFYTEIYKVSKDIGNAINNNTTQLGEAIDNNIRSTEKSAIYISEETARSTRIVRDMLGWLIVALGAIDVSVFIYLLVAACSSDQTVESIDYNLSAVVGQMQREAAARAKQEAEEKAKRKTEQTAEAPSKEKAQQDTSEKSTFDAAVQAKWEASWKARQETTDQNVSTEEAKPKAEKTLKEKLEYALKFSSDDGMISYLKLIDDEAVQAILSSPANLVREQIEKLLASM